MWVSLLCQTDKMWDVKLMDQLRVALSRNVRRLCTYLGGRRALQPAITYTSRGIADLRSAVGHATPDGLKRLLGASQARAMIALQKPQTTIEIAAGLKLSSAAASEQIAKLWRAGILERTRIGRRVFYSLNEKGKAVFTVFHN